jgi:hypothetical protein
VCLTVSGQADVVARQRGYTLLTPPSEGAFALLTTIGIKSSWEIANTALGHPIAVQDLTAAERRQLDNLTSFLAKIAEVPPPSLQVAVNLRDEYQDLVPGLYDSECGQICIERTVLDEPEILHRTVFVEYAKHVAEADPEGGNYEQALINWGGRILFGLHRALDRQDRK